MTTPNEQYKPTPIQEAVNYMYDYGYDHLRENASAECRRIMMPLFGVVTSELKLKAEEARNDGQ